MRTKSESRKQAIVETAKTIFCEQGYESTSMSEIASRVGGSKATLYNYFKSKEEIFKAVMDVSAEGELSRAFRELSPDQNIEAALLQFGINYLHSIMQPEIMAIRRLAVHEAERSEVGKHFYQQGPHIGWTMVSQYLSQMMDKNILERVTPWVCAMHLKGLLEAEILEERFLGVCARPDRTELTPMCQRAISVFLRAYQVR